MIVSPKALVEFCRALLLAAGVSADHAAVITQVIVDADLRGKHSHGVGLLPLYVRGIIAGQINASPEMRVLRKRGVISVLDGDNGLGHVVGTLAMEMAIDRAREDGLGLVAVRRSNHFGAAGYFADLAADQGMIGYTTSNAAPVMPAWGGRTAALGNNPIAYAFPGKNPMPHLTLDMACTVVARGKIRIAAERGARIPEGWATAADGVPTTDPHLALQGLLLPFGGYKGYGLALVSEILAGVLSGALTTTTIPRATADGAEGYASQGLGHLMLAIDIGAFMPLSEYEQRMQMVIDALKSSGASAGDVLLPGEQSHARRNRQLEEGIDLPATTIEQLNQLARDVNVPPLASVSPR